MSMREIMSEAATDLGRAATRLQRMGRALDDKDEAGALEKLAAEIMLLADGIEAVLSVAGMRTGRAH